MKLSEILKRQNAKLMKGFLTGLVLLFAVFQYAVFYLEANFTQKSLDSWLRENKIRISESLFVENTLAIKSIITKSRSDESDLSIAKITVLGQSGAILSNLNDSNPNKADFRRGFGFTTKLLPPAIAYYSELTFAGKPQGFLYVESPLDQKALLINTALLVFLMFGFYLYYIREQSRFGDLLNEVILEPVNQLSKQMGQGLPASEDGHDTSAEMTALFRNFNEMLERLNDLSEEKARRTKATVAFEIAKQVVHDIRSPLSALNMAASTLHQVPEDRRVLIRNAIARINDIANILLSKNGSPAPEVTLAPASTSIELMAALVDSLVSEKRVQYRDRIGVEIEVDLRDSYGAFALVNRSEFKIVLSNLINNSVEALKDGSGKITVGLRRYRDKVEIIVQDSGQGFQPEILARVGEKGLSYGKSQSSESGSGLGLHHAKATVESLGGSLKVNSQLGEGTMVLVHLPRVPAPEWFVQTLKLPSHATIVIIDDDTSIHQIWDDRFEAGFHQDMNFKVLSFTSALEFRSWFQVFGGAEATYLFDYELLNQPETGLDLIESLNIADQSILVTSHFEEPELRKRAKALGVSILPKTMAPFVPIEVTKQAIAH